MNIKPDNFNSKLLLFGEYGLMFDAMALSVPFSRFGGSLDYDSTYIKKESNSEIRKLFGYLASLEKGRLHHPLDLKALRDALDRGLYFNSNIPQQYGLGSSGALVAALFSRYTDPPVEKNKVSLNLLKADLALLESYFHGQSSGLDPLTSFLNQPLLLGSKKEIHTLDLDLAQTGWSFALIDTKTKGATAPLVQHFIESLSQPVFKAAFLVEFLPSSDGCIQSLLKGDSITFFQSLKQLIHFELMYFRQMIPSRFNELITDALSQQVFIKLLGSGGGGYLLAISPRENIMKEWADKESIQLLKVV